MAWYNPVSWLNKNSKILTEEMKSFKNKGDDSVSDRHLELRSGEGIDDIALINNVQGYGKEALTSFNQFYNSHINVEFQNERARIFHYRQMAEMTEIADVVEDAVIESTHEDTIGNLLTLEIRDTELKGNTNIVNNLQEEFNDLFYNRIDIKEALWDIFRTYYIDGRVYYERLIHSARSKNGIIGIKKLPSETMDYIYDPRTGKTIAYFQYLNEKGKKYSSIDEARQDENVIVFYPEQIGFVNYGVYGANKTQILGYLEKSKQPYNQLKLLETSVIIYRLVRSPERLVFRIDTGNMPKDKAMKFVEKIKQKFTKKITYDSTTGQMSNSPEVFSVLENFFLPQCLRLSTKINTLDGKEKTLDQIIDEYNNGIKNEVYSVDQKTGEMIKGEVEWAGITRKNAELIRVWIDNGEYVDCTPDHKFVMRDGSEVEAKDLKENDSLMPLYLRNERINRNKKSNKYRQVFDLKNKKWEFVHRKMGISPKKGCAIHHKNWNRFDNTSTNLELLPIQDHIKLHYESNKERESHIPLLKALNRPENREKQKNAASEHMINRFKSIEERNKMGGLLKQRWIDQRDIFMENVSKPRSTEHKKSLSSSIKNKWEFDFDYRKRSSKSSKDRWENEDFKTHMKNIQRCIIDDKCEYFILLEILRNNFPSMPVLLESLSNNSYFMDHWSTLNINRKNVNKEGLGKSSLYSIIKYIGFNDYTELKNNITINHKVDRIEYLDCREDTGCLTIKDCGNNHNFGLTSGIFVKNSADGRGSQIDSVGGNAAGFAELDDIYYFARKLYRSLKYPMSRVSAQESKSESDIIFGGTNAGEIQRDEIKWSKFLERHQMKFCNEFVDLFLLHLDFKGLKKEYDLNKSKLHIVMTSPNNYKDQMAQQLLSTQMDNYSNLSNNEEFSKTFLMREYLGWDEEMLRQNQKGFDDDKKYLPKQDDGY